MLQSLGHKVWPWQASLRNSTRKLWLSHPRLARTHYQTLGISNGASQADIKRAFYDLSMKFHPDKVQGHDDKFREISTAYEVLGNPRLRRLYDRGLLSDEQIDADIHYPKGSGYGEIPLNEEDKERIKASVKTFDKWAQNHYSQTFYRGQYERDAKKKNQSYSKESKGGTALETILLAGMFLGLVYSVISTFNKRKPATWNRSEDKKS